jgi:membrane-bound lytic murein transglycosylase D
MRKIAAGFVAILPFMVIACLLAACASKEKPVTAVEVEPPSPFPRPDELEPQISFWSNVYAVWTLDQVALHDNRHLNLVYEVIDLPGPGGDHYTRKKRRFVNVRKDALAHRLRSLERKVARGAPLNRSEQALADTIEAAAGPGALYGASERLRGQRGLRERFKRGLEISGRYDALFRHEFRQAGLPEDLAYLPHVESSFQAHARSSAGATGMWQFTRGAARIYMTNHPALDERLDPVASARGAARYLGDAYGKLGAWPLAVTSYNHGIGGMKRAKRRYGTDFPRIVREYQHRYFGFASRNFYTEFMAARDIARNPERYFPEGINYEPPLDWDRITLRRSAPVSDVAIQYCVNRRTLTHMNPAWTQAALNERVPLPAGTDIWLPTGTLKRTAQTCRFRGNTVAKTDSEIRNAQ